jgi:hypothetical protein
MIYILILNNDERYEDYSEWIAGIFATKKEAVAHAKKETVSDLFVIDEWEVGKSKYNKYFAYEFSNITRKWTA